MKGRLMPLLDELLVSDSKNPKYGLFECSFIEENESIYCKGLTMDLRIPANANLCGTYYIKLQFKKTTIDPIL